MRVIFIFSCLLLSCTTECARILGIFPLPGRSHYILGSSLMRELAERGHDVTIITPFSEKHPPRGGSYREIMLTTMLAEIESQKEENNFYEMTEMNPLVVVPFLAQWLSEIGEMALRDKNVIDFINSKERFDAVIIEQFYNDAHKALASHFEGVQIIFSTVGANYWLNPLVGNPAPLSYVPDILTSFDSNMSFYERFINTLVFLQNTAIHHLYLYPKHNSVIQKYIPNAPCIQEVLYNASLVLLNSHPSLNQPAPHVPNMVEIGGFHIKKPKDLPKDLKDFLDSATEGVIYFSMGSNLRSADLPINKREAILKVFSKLKYKILWKWEEDSLPGQPTNVKLSKWLPQQDILAHPNVKLFITHGGLLSTSETVYHGVPILAIPIYGDQKLNALVAVKNGFGLSLPFTELSEESLEKKLSELLNNPIYATNAKLKSQIFNDRQVAPLDTAIYWIEYVIRHKGAKHLRVAALDLPWYKYYLIDVMGLIASIAVTTLYVNYIALKMICRKLCGQKKENKLKKQ